jgi:hypothetical protein
VTGGRPVVAVVRDADLLGCGEPADAAFADGLVGLVRILATEGIREAWISTRLPSPTTRFREGWGRWVATGV